MPRKPKVRKIEDTALSSLTKLSTSVLTFTLEKWSRTANQRARRMEKLDPNYSALYEFHKGGKFGKHETYRSRESILNELARIKNIAPKLKTKKVKKEKQEIEDIYREQTGKTGDVSSGIKNKIPLDKFRKAFAIFKAGRGMIIQEIYERIKDAVLSMTDRDLNDVVNLITRLYDNFVGDYYDSLEDFESSGFEPYEDEDVPW